MQELGLGGLSAWGVWIQNPLRALTVKLLSTQME